MQYLGTIGFTVYLVRECTDISTDAWGGGGNMRGNTNTEVIDRSRFAEFSSKYPEGPPA